MLFQYLKNSTPSTYSPLTVRSRIDTPLITIEISLQQEDGKSYAIFITIFHQAIATCSILVPGIRVYLRQAWHRLAKIDSHWPRPRASVSWTGRRPIEDRVASPRLATPTRARRGGRDWLRDGVARVIAMYEASTRFRVDREFQSSENT